MEKDYVVFNQNLAKKLIQNGNILKNVINKFNISPSCLNKYLLNHELKNINFEVQYLPFLTECPISITKVHISTTIGIPSTLK